MGGDCGTWLPQLHCDWQSPNPNSLGAPLEMGQQNNISAYMNPPNDLAPTNGSFPAYESSKLPHSRVGQANEPHGWFYCLPRFRQAFTPALNSNPKGRLPVNNAYESCMEAVTPNVGSGSAQKRFLVIDQSRDQTTMIFSSGIGTPVQFLTSWSPNPNGVCNVNGEDPGTKRDSNYLSGPLLTDEFNENDGTDVQSEMHEDTEELNALLYSDDESDYSEDDEVTSTGHSPNTMTAHDNKDWFEGSTEEVASSAGPTKKQKLFNGGCDDDVPSLMDTASSVKPNKPIEFEDDAESSCANCNNAVSGEMGCLSGNKRKRIRETVSVLQNIIPGGRGKDAIVVLDEAINYLKSLKHKAEALGIDSL